MSLTLIVRRRLEAAASMAIRVPRIFWLSYGLELGDSGRSYGYWSKDQILNTEVSATKVTRCAMCSVSPRPATVASVAASAKNIALR